MLVCKEQVVVGEGVGVVVVVVVDVGSTLMWTVSIALQGGVGVVDVAGCCGGDFPPADPAPG